MTDIEEEIEEVEEEDEEEEEELNEEEQQEVQRRVQERLRNVSSEKLENPKEQEKPKPQASKPPKSAVDDDIAKFEEQEAAGQRKLQAVSAKIELNKLARQKKLALLKACFSGDANGIEKALLDSSVSANEAVSDPSNGKGPVFPLFAAIQSGSYECVKVLLSNGAEVKSVPNALLEACSKKGRSNIVACLVALGSNSLFMDSFGNSAIHLCCKCGDSEAVLILLEHDHDLISSKTGNERKWTPLHVAVNYNQIETAKELVAKGADINEISVGGIPQESPLQLVARTKNEEMVKWLVGIGADVNIGKSRQLPTPLQLATNGGGGESIAAFLLEHGAEPLIHVSIKQAQISQQQQQQSNTNVTEIANKQSQHTITKTSPNAALNETDIQKLQKRITELEEMVKERDAIIEQLKREKSPK